ncbi:MAG TPA: hypothetical protein VMR33_12550 [Candidatus Baltobacteraceae bacterium]|nr:hypothetical protein [Candidatus Baltobacteraceae bacterium]
MSGNPKTPRKPLATLFEDALAPEVQHPIVRNLRPSPKRFGNCNGPSAATVYNGALIRFVMAVTQTKSAALSRSDPSRNAVETILSSATEAFTGAFMVWILGRVAINIAGSISRRMVPSLPPGFGGPQAGHPNAWWHALRGAALGIFFSIFFIHSLWEGFHRKGERAGTRLERILSRLRENWFSLIVGNAIGAWVAIFLLSIVPNFSPLKMLLQWVCGLVLPLVREVGLFVFGASNAASLNDWFSWYNANQMKLYFWILYSGGAFDDLGVPNFKTLARWVWHRMQRRRSANSPAPVDRPE